MPTDPWRHAYIYRRTPEPPGFVLYSAGYDGVDDHGADGELLHPAPGQRGCRVAFGKAAAQVRGRIGARDVVELIADVVGFQQVLVGCHSNHYASDVRT